MCTPVRAHTQRYTDAHTHTHTLSLSLSLTHTLTHTHTYTRVRARARAEFEAFDYTDHNLPLSVDQFGGQTTIVLFSRN